MNFLFKFDNQGLHLFRCQLNTNNSLILDLLDSLSKLKRLDGFFDMIISSTGSTDKSCLWVTTKTFFKKFGKGGLSEWNISPLTKSLDDTTKNSKTQVDLFSFF